MSALTEHLGWAERWAGWLLLALASASASVAAATDSPPVDVLPLNEAWSVRALDGRDLVFEALPGKSTGYADIARRFCRPRSVAALSAYNEDRPVQLGEPVRIPLGLLRDEYRELVLTRVFPQDRLDGKDWVHLSRRGALPLYNEGLWQVAEWFTGDGSRFSELMAVNALVDPELQAGQPVRIPGEALHPALKRGPRSGDGSLEYGADATGSYAVYRLQPGEALYSAVVLRYTGRTSAEDVTGTAVDIAVRSGIEDLTDIPAGFRVKIALELLEPEFLPRDHPRRRESEAARREMAAALAVDPPARARGLADVVVVLDPGHGGRDLGTMNNGLWEHDYVYDVACRLKGLLEARTEARVVMTLIDRKTGCRPSRTDRLLANREGTVQTDPPFLAREEGEARVAVNLRWYLSNAVYRRTVKNGGQGDRVIFLSLHADALHPSLRGLMVYVPSSRLSAGRYGHGSKSYRRFRQVREQPYVDFSKKTRVRSEALSRKLAASLLDSFRAGKLPIHEDKPIRDRIIRGRKTIQPAVLRGNEVPAKVLVELVNISNTKDARLLSQSGMRQRMAEALLDGIWHYFGERGPLPRGSSDLVAAP